MEHTERYGNAFDELVRDAPKGLDVVIPSRRDRIAPLLRSFEPDLLLCAGFPWKIPPDALAVARLGSVNAHPGLLPEHRGPSPVAWAIRNGENEAGFTFHRMDAELDTGPISRRIRPARRRALLGRAHAEADLDRRRALPDRSRPGRGGRSRRSAGGRGTYEPFFEREYAWIDWTRPALDIYRQVRAWRFASATGEPPGALSELDGKTVRILRTSLEPADGREMACGDGKIWILETESV